MAIVAPTPMLVFVSWSISDICAHSGLRREGGFQFRHESKNHVQSIWLQTLWPQGFLYVFNILKIGTYFSIYTTLTILLVAS